MILFVDINAPLLFLTSIRMLPAFIDSLNVILITLYGIDLYGYDVETDKEWRYYDNSDNKITYKDALDYVKLI